VIIYDGVPTYAVSVMKFADDLVTHETLYFADPFQAPAWRAATRPRTGPGFSAASASFQRRGPQ
jgi:hypothetical protein